MNSSTSDLEPTLSAALKTLHPLLIASTLLLLVLLTACANLGNLLLALSVTREREFLIRAAIGATRGRIVRQLMTESIALALLSALAGLALSSLATSILVRTLNWPAYMDVSPDWRVATFAFLSGLFASLFCGLAPALQVTRANPVRAARLRHFFIGAQAAACCGLLIISGLLTRGLFKTILEKPGFAYEQSAVIDPNLDGVGRSGQSARINFEQLKTRLSEINGVQSASSSPSLRSGNKDSQRAFPSGRPWSTKLIATTSPPCKSPCCEAAPFVPETAMSRSSANALPPAFGQIKKLSGRNTPRTTAKSAEP